MMQKVIWWSHPLLRKFSWINHLIEILLKFLTVKEETICMSNWYCKWLHLAWFEAASSWGQYSAQIIAAKGKNMLIYRKLMYSYWDYCFRPSSYLLLYYKELLPAWCNPSLTIKNAARGIMEVSAWVSLCWGLTSRWVIYVLDLFHNKRIILQRNDLEVWITMR